MSTEPWMLLKDGAEKVATQRLSDLHQLVTGTVNQFHRDATSQIDAIHGEAHEGLGAELFKALHGVMMVCFPEEYIIEKMAAEVVKGARDAALASIGQSEAASAQGRLNQAKDELRRKLDELAAATDEAMRAAWYAGVAHLPAAVEAVFTAHPEYKNTEFGSNASEWEGWLCDQIGVRDAFVANPSAHITEQLWQAFHHDFYRATARLHFYEIDGDTERLLFLLRDIAPASDVHEFLGAIGADVPYWDRRVRMYHAAHGTDINDLFALQIIEAAILSDEG
jgi:hypothetical protein